MYMQVLTRNTFFGSEIGCMTFTRFISRQCKGLAAYLIILPLGGCSFNEYGASTARVFQAEGAFVYELEARGVHLATDQHGLSINFGTYREVVAFDAVCLPSDARRLNRKSLRKSADPVLSVREVHGIAMAVGARETGITIGQRQHAMLLSGDIENDAYRELFFDLHQLGKTQLKTRGWSSCRQ